MIIYIIPLLAGFILDLIFGDPRRLPHIVRAFGFFIGGLEKIFYKKHFDDSANKRAAFTGGIIFVSIVLLVCVSPPLLLLSIAYKGHIAAGLILETFIIFQIIAVKDLRVESMRVYTQIKAGDIEGARAALSMIVGRDTKNLDEAAIVRAAVETVAENNSDGAAAPLFYIALGGGAAGAVYKAANTMDSMVGYKNKKYYYFGCAAARLDDFLNFLPSRIAAVLMIAAAALLRYDVRGAVRIWKRDRRKHASPNSAQTEAVCAGALGLRLAGPAYYENKLEEKPFIGDEKRKIEAHDIVRANNLHYAASVLMLIFAIGVRLCCMAAIFTATTI
jgi:adenosylcobinamide-phosphate synthase